MLADLIFTTPAIEAILADEAEWQLMLDFEAALATAQAAVGEIPESAAASIRAVCAEGDWDLEAVRQQTLLAGNPAIPMVSALRARVADRDAEAAPYVHRGATSQDVIDTVLMGQLRMAIALLLSDLHQLTDLLTRLANAHVHTPMMGRTLLQQALPITFGQKATAWLDGLVRQKGKLQQLAGEVIVLQLGGPVGTGDSFGEHQKTISETMADALNLGSPTHAWHTQRDRVADLAGAFGTINGLLGKLATDVVLLMQTEVGEVREGAADGKGGSSSMPHKRNPVSSTFMVAIAHRTPALVATLLSTMLQPHERAAGPWHAEWAVVRELLRLTAANLHHANDLISSLEIDTARMKSQLG
ncbi:3-carboxy-cis,cis-muconate cycloisomerase [Fibrella aquatilis]|uniref:3-carboxy-cis,cis-muconate cycloisomerase n=1 Tax=Fibrella aquatilis TaxID=2817059 RepID=A0A939G0R0_9BACT|nr:3-carboxy-cis,cis-muconate cycloisomerase [Fibrella aquatilis]MBO0929731.1 3-carboxy-cis,cis-muconate cycloisomerase [Fibrella aquatilis]